MAASEESVVHGSPACPSPSAAEPHHLPSLDRLLRQPGVAALLREHGHTLVAAEARALLALLRTQALARALHRDQLGPEALAQQLAARLHQRLAPRLRRVLNLTGTVIHTNLGRALLADQAAQPAGRADGRPEQPGVRPRQRRPRRPRQPGRGPAVRR
jgi:L-seryl-tRNA(Ser) seleniumtransferase